LSFYFIFYTTDIIISDDIVFLSFLHASTCRFAWFSVRSWGTSLQRSLTLPIAFRCRTTVLCAIPSLADILRVIVDGLLSTDLRSIAEFKVAGLLERGWSWGSFSPFFKFLKPSLSYVRCNNIFTFHLSHFSGRRTFTVILFPVMFE